MLVIFTDLDGTLLDRRTYSCEEAAPALAFVRDHKIPLVFCSSKTRAEVEYWRARLDNQHPFIVENGGALYIPKDYFGFRIHAPAYRGQYAVFEFGTPYSELTETLNQAASETACQLLAFHQMSAGEVRARYGMTLHQASLAKQRESDEPFEIVSGQMEALLASIEKRGKRWLAGGHLFHILGVNDKSHCVGLLASYYERAFPKVRTIGLGDGPNDVRFLRSVDIPILLRSRVSEELISLVPRAQVTDREGPQGWNEAVLALLKESEEEMYCASAPMF
jgi:mannosyl-3-phosphoglycerate phosphatase